MLMTKIELPEEPDFLTGGGEMEQHIRAFDWSKTSLGSIDSWSSNLKYTVRLCLTSRFPMLIFYGSDAITLYNDAFIPLVKNRHPSKILGLPAKAAYGDSGSAVESVQQQVMETGRSISYEDLRLFIEKKGFIEERYFTLCHNPIGLAGKKTEGLLVILMDTTDRVIHERHLQVLNALRTHSTEAKNTADACRLIAGNLFTHDVDIPFALIYLLDANRYQAILQGAAHVEPGTSISPHILSLDKPGECVWSLTRVTQSKKLEVIDISQWDGLPLDRWGAACRQAVLVPLISSESVSPMGIFIAGVNSRRELDEDYRGFYTLVASLISTALVNAKIYEREQQRLEKFAKMDIAKTMFFSNVSHELRTPLALVLSSLEEALSDTEYPPSAMQIERLEMMQRNALRLLKLANTLLDFSRIEAGRWQGYYEATDLANLTVDLSSVFRGAMEKAGLALKVDVMPLDEPVYVDHSMWEKIFFNLLSNALKYTLKGSITITLKKADQHVELRDRKSVV